MILMLSFVLIVAAMILHELGHAVAMLHRKVQVSRIGIGMAIPFLPNLRLKFRLVRYGAVFEIKPIPLFAYVEPTRRGNALLERMSYKDAAVVYGAGVLVNFAFAAFLVACALLLDPKSFGPKQAVFVGIASAIMFLMWSCRRFFCRYLTLPIGFAMTLLIFWSAFNYPITQVLSGPIGIAKDAANYASNISESLRFAGIISMSLGLANCLPVFPADGGRILDSLLHSCGVKSKGRDWLKVGGALMFLCLVATASLSDLWNLFH